MANYSSFDDLVNDLEKLIQTIEDIRQTIVTECEIPYDSQDARQVALDGLQCDISACGMWIKSLMSLKWLCQNKNGDIWREEYRKSIGTGFDKAEKAEDMMLDYLRNTLTTKVHFKIENLFNNILACCGNEERGFKRICKETLKLAEIPIDGPEADKLNALAYLRNSYHNNGIHKNKKELSVKIDGIQFEFCNGKPVECASWMHIVVIMKANISVIESVLTSPKIVNIKGEIPDAFAANYA